MDALPARLDWARRLQALAQTGLTYTTDRFDVERYEAIRRIAAEIAAGPGSADDAGAFAEAFKRESGYATPKIDVRGVVFDAGGKILLVRERSDGRWTLPGGWADVGSSPAENVTREIFEEAGFQARAVRLLAVFDRSRHGHPPMLQHVYKLFFLCEIIGGAAAVAGTSETDGVAFFGPDELPPLSTERVTASHLRRFFERREQPDAITDFD